MGERVKITPAMVSAYLWLQQRGGNGVIDRYGRLLASGETAKQFDAATWLRLVAIGAIDGDNSQTGRLRTTSAGASLFEDSGRSLHPNPTGGAP